ncbi:MAG: replicative DNA helicase [FCB group bacterium]|nr:replicative DNA helicase [FCB group bacterium]
MAETPKSNLRLPPHSVEAEQAVLGCMMLEAETVPKVLHFLKPESFYKNAHLKIFESMLVLFNKNQNIDTITVIDQLQKDDALEEVGGAYYLTGLSNDAPSAENVEYYAKIVQTKYVLRSIISASIEMSELAYEARDEITDILDRVEQKIFTLSEQSLRGEFIPVDDLLHDVLDKFGSRREGDVIGVPSGITGLDDLLSGFQDSDFIVLAGRPSMGKTALSLSIARNIAVDYKKSVGFFSLEMSNTQLTERLITAEAQVDSHLVRTGKLPKREWQKLSRAAGPLSEAKIFIDDSPGLNIMEIRAKARRLKAEHHIDILFVDYLQLINGIGRVESRQQEITMISRSLKALAKELSVPVVGLSQLSRAPETRTDHRPIMSDLRESGSIEQDADVVLFIYRKYVYTRNEEDKGTGEIIISKHRNGPTGVVPVAFVDKYAKFANLDYFAEEFEQGIPG